MDSLNFKQVKVQRYPYGSPENNIQKKKSFPVQNLHYAHHDSVFPSKDLMQLYEEYNKRLPEGKKLAEIDRFATEYKRRYQLASPEFREQLRYMVPGEFAGKRTFKDDETLVNPTANQEPQLINLSSQASQRQLQQHNAYENNPSDFMYQIRSQMNNNEAARQSVTPTRGERRPISVEREVQTQDQDRMSPMKLVRRAPMPEQQQNNSQIEEKAQMYQQEQNNHNPNQYQAYLNQNMSFTPSRANRYNEQGNQEKQKQVSSSMRDYLNKSQELPSLKQQLRGAGQNILRANNMSIIDQTLPKNQEYPYLVQTRNYKGDLRDLYNVSLTDSPPRNLVLTEQERYLQRLRQSIEKQSHIYSQHANSILYPSKIESLHKLENQINHNQSTLQQAREVPTLKGYNQRLNQFSQSIDYKARANVYGSDKGVANARYQNEHINYSNLVNRSNML